MREMSSGIIESNAIQSSFPETVAHPVSVAGNPLDWKAPGPQKKGVRHQE